MKRNHLFRKMFALSFCACLCLASLATQAKAETTGSSDAAGKIKNGDIIRLGKEDDSIGFTADWIVLDAAQTNTGEEGMFLVAKDLIGADSKNGMLYRDIGEDIVVTFDNRGEEYAASHPDVLNYQGSDIQKWCADFLNSHFSEAEQSALIKTYKSDAAYQKPIVFGGKNTSVDFDSAEDILNGDQIFLLSVEEANNPDYGFTNDKSRIATLNGVDGMWWLRSPHTPTYPLDVGMVFTTGSIMDFPVNAETGFSTKFLTCARPACNLDTSKIITATVKETKKDGSTVWELTLEGDIPTASDASPNYAPVIIGITAMVILILILALVLKKRKSIH